MAILTFIIFLVVFGLLIFIHEFGHFAASKLSGVAVEEFAIGFGPIIFSRKYKETTYTLRAIPLGGFVRPKGERGAKTDDKDAYINQPLKNKLFILFAGVFMNFVLAVILGAVYMNLVNYRAIVQNLVDYPFVGPQVTTIPVSIRVTQVVEGSPAAGKIVVGDLITQLDDEKVESREQVLKFLDKNQGEKVELTLINADTFEKYEVEVKLNKKKKEDDVILGVAFAKSANNNPAAEVLPSFYILNYPASIVSGFTYAVDMFGYQIAAFGSSINQAVSQSDASIVTDQLAGPVGVLDIVGQILSSERIKELINLTVVLNLALAFFNILPLPILDGGQAVIEIIEAIRKKPFSERTMNILMYGAIGFMLILFLIVFINDLGKAGVFSSISNAFKQAAGR